MARRDRLLAWTIAAATTLASGAALADAPFLGTWSPTCKPAAGAEVDNQLATIVFISGAVKFSNLECEIVGWRKARRRYVSDLNCFRKGAEASKLEIVVRPLDDGQLKIKIADGGYRRVVERCGN